MSERRFRRNVNSSIENPNIISQIRVPELATTICWTIIVSELKQIFKIYAELQPDECNWTLRKVELDDKENPFDINFKIKKDDFKLQLEGFLEKSNGNNSLNIHVQESLKRI